MKIQKLSPFIIFIIFSCNHDNDAGGKNSTSESNNTSQIAQFESISDSLSDNSIEINDLDTVEINGYKLYFEPIENDTLFADYFIDQTERNNLIKELGNSHEQAIIIEKYLHKKLNDIFDYNDSILTIKLLNNSEIKFKKWSDSLELGHNFYGYLKDKNFVLNFIQYAEGSGYQLVNLKNGKFKYLCGMPFFSPFNEYVLTTNIDLDAGYSFNGFELFKLEQDTLRELFHLELSDWGAERIKWISKNSVILEKLIWNIVDDKLLYKKKYIKMTILRNIN